MQEYAVGASTCSVNEQSKLKNGEGTSRGILENRKRRARLAQDTSVREKSFMSNAQAGRPKAYY